MNNNQKQLLTDLAKKIKSEQKNRQQIVVSLTSAKILGKKEKLTNHFSNLEKVVITSN